MASILCQRILFYALYATHGTLMFGTRPLELFKGREGFDAQVFGLLVSVMGFEGPYLSGKSQKVLVSNMCMTNTHLEVTMLPELVQSHCPVTRGLFIDLKAVCITSYTILSGTVCLYKICSKV